MVVLGWHAPAIFINKPSMQRTPADRRMHSACVQPSSCTAYTLGGTYQHPPARNTLARQLQPLGSLGLTWCCWSRSESIGQYAQGKRERLCAKTAGAFIRNDDVEISQHEGEGGRHAAKDRISKFE